MCARKNALQAHAACSVFHRQQPNSARHLADPCSSCTQTCLPASILCARALNRGRMVRPLICSCRQFCLPNTNHAPCRQQRAGQGCITNTPQNHAAGNFSHLWLQCECACGLHRRNVLPLRVGLLRNVYALGSNAKHALRWRGNFIRGQPRSAVVLKTITRFFFVFFWYVCVRCQSEQHCNEMFEHCTSCKRDRASGLVDLRGQLFRFNGAE